MINLNNFMGLVKELERDKDILKEIYSAWATGEPFALPYPYLRKYVTKYESLSNSLSKFYKQLKKGKLEKFYFILGEYGAGKTQLMYYIKEELRHLYRVESIYISLDEFDQKSEKDILLKIKELIRIQNNSVVLFLDDLDFYFSRYGDKAGKEAYGFLNALFHTLRDKFGGRLKTIVVSLNSELFKAIFRHGEMIDKHVFRWKVLLDLDLEFENFLSISLDVGFRLLAIQYILEYYPNFRRKIERNFDIIVEYLYNLTLRIARFGIRTIGLYLKMVNDRLVDFIRYFDESRSIRPSEAQIKHYVRIVDRYLKDHFNKIILTFDRIQGFSRYRIDYESKMDNYMIGKLHVTGLDPDVDGVKVSGTIGAYYIDSDRVDKTVDILKSKEADDVDYYLVFLFIRKKRKIREEIERVYLKIGRDMLRFSIVPLDMNMLKYALYLTEDGYALFVEKNTTTKKDLEEAINILANNKLLEAFANLPEEEQKCENLVKAVFLWTQSWILKSGVCRVKKRDLYIIRKFFRSFFPQKFYGLGSEEIFNKLIQNIAKKSIAKIRKNRLILGEKMDEDRVIEEVTKIAEEQFCKGDEKIRIEIKKKRF
ncbi:MAG: AAA family ATPase [Candidatus Njordarchaeia archaeon]